MYTTEAIQRRTRLSPICTLLAMVLGVCAVARSQNRTESPAGTDQGGIESHLGAGYADLKNDRYTEAARQFRAALALDPKLAMRARFPLAVALFESHRFPEARQEFIKVHAQVGDRPDVMYYLGRLDLDEGAYAAAIHELLVASKHPPFPDTAYYLGSAYLKSGQFTQAANWLEEAANLNPNDAHVEERLAAAYKEAGRQTDARRVFAHAATLRERDAALGGERMDCAQRLDNGPLDQARPACARLFDPKDFERLTMLGTLYGQHGDYEDALDPLERAAELNPNSPQAQYNLALDCFRLQRYAEARDALTKVVKLWPDLAPLSALYGSVLLRLGENAAAYEALSRAYRLDPRDSNAAAMLYDAGLSLAGQSLAGKQYAASARYLNEMVELFPQAPEPHRLLAEVYRAAGEPSEAAEEQRQFEARLARAGTQAQ